jgi:hypothetical protein
MKSVQKRIRRTDFFYLKLNTSLLPYFYPSYLIFVWYINLESYNFYNILAFHNKEKLYEYMLQTDSIRCTRNLAEAVPVEKTLSIFELLTSGGLAGNIIMASLF